MPEQDVDVERWIEAERSGGACSVVKCYTQHASQVIHSSISVRDLHALTHPRKNARRKNMRAIN